jgi:hypothetical protein
MLILESSDVAKACTAYFEALFEQYQKHGAPLPLNKGNTTVMLASSFWK